MKFLFMVLSGTILKHKEKWPVSFNHRLTRCNIFIYIHTTIESDFYPQSCVWLTVPQFATSPHNIVNSSALNIYMLLLTYCVIITSFIHLVYYNCKWYNSAIILYNYDANKNKIKTVLRNYTKDIVKTSDLVFTTQRFRNRKKIYWCVVFSKFYIQLMSTWY